MASHEAGGSPIRGVGIGAWVDGARRTPFQAQSTPPHSCESLGRRKTQGHGFRSNSFDGFQVPADRNPLDIRPTHAFPHARRAPCGCAFRRLCEHTTASFRTTQRRRHHERRGLSFANRLSGCQFLCSGMDSALFVRCMARYFGFLESHHAQGECYYRW